MLEAPHFKVLERISELRDMPDSRQKDEKYKYCKKAINLLARVYSEANKQYVALTDELTGTQNRISVARGRYIESIQLLNTAVRRFPGNVFAGMFGFAQKDYYQAKLESMNTSVLGVGVLS